MRVVSLVMLCALMLLLVAVLRVEPPVLQLENESGLAVRSVEVAVGGQRLQLGGLAPGENLPRPLGLRADGPLRVEVCLEDGRTLRAEGGYFTPGMRGGNRLRIVSADTMLVERR